MKRINFLLIATVILFGTIGCDVAKNLNIAEVESLHIQYDANQDVNFGGKFTGRVVANLRSGKEVDVTKSRYLTVGGPNVGGGGGGFRVLKNFPTSFSESLVVAELSLTKKEATVGTRDTILMNFGGGFSFHSEGQPGNNGVPGEDASNKIVSNGLIREGRSGGDGGAAYSGYGGEEIKLYVWKKGALYYLSAADYSGQVLWIYKTTASDDIVIKLHGGNGGQGGRGGDGGSGRRGFEKSNGKVREPGNGGSGGYGGSGGHGGLGGSLTLIVHPSASGFEAKVIQNMSGGAGGSGGVGGGGGEPGSPMETQAAANVGGKGLDGPAGEFGAMGTFVIEVVDFDISVFEWR
jgi:hypothetical protein